MIHETFPWRLRNEYEKRLPEDHDLVMDLEGRSILVREGSAGIEYPTVKEWREWQNESSVLIYAFRLEHVHGESPTRHCFLALRPHGAQAPAPSGWVRRVARDLREFLPEYLSLAAATAQHIHDWYSLNRICGRCGTPMVHSEKERCMQCPACRNAVYPRISPCVIVAVTHGDRLLMTRYAHSDIIRYVLVAGFIEVGETAEQAVAREVMEETGIRVKNIRYWGSQPWGFTNTLPLGFFAELDGPDTIRVDTSELAEARWFSREDIPRYPNNSSMTMAMIRSFIANTHPKKPKVVV